MTPVPSPKRSRCTSSFAPSVMKKFASGVPFGNRARSLPPNPRFGRPTSAGCSRFEVEFIVTEQEGDELLDLIRREQVRLFYARIPADFGVINPDASDAGEVADN